MTRKIKYAGTEKTRILAFEPFEGNHRYFLENAGSFENIELIAKAVSAQSGVSEFCVPSVVGGNEQNWEKMTGYSSVGFLIDEEKQNRAANAQKFSIETVAIDDVVHEQIDFLKIDVQGGELDVLKGCERLMKNQQIDVIYVEFSGDKRILDLLTSHQYSIFDTDYLVVPKEQDDSFPEKIQDLGFYDFSAVNLSTGKGAYHVKLNLPDREYCLFLKEFRQRYGYIQTGLICVSRKFLPQFFINLGQFLTQSNASIQPTKSIAIPSPSLAVDTKHANLPSKNATPIPGSFASTPPNNSTVLATSLLKRIANYYRRWPILLAGIAIVLNLFALSNTPYRWLFGIGSTGTLLFLIGHAASKADYVLAEVEELKKKLIAPPKKKTKKQK